SVSRPATADELNHGEARRIKFSSNGAGVRDKGMADENGFCVRADNRSEGQRSLGSNDGMSLGRRLFTFCTLYNLEASKFVIDAEEVDYEWLKPCAIGIAKEDISIGGIQEAMESDRIGQLLGLQYDGNKDKLAATVLALEEADIRMRVKETPKETKILGTTRDDGNGDAVSLTILIEGIRGGDNQEGGGGG
ncbi:hypothetical protein U1Q18_033788, partial [Sarracenia purpurea var. burkii]